MIADCTALILAGGRSRRMGQDKATTLLAGETLLNRVAQRIGPLFSELLISVREPYPHLAYPQIIDQAASQGPMVGVVTALRQITTTWLFVIACDMPFVSSHLIQAMADHRQQQEVIASKIAGVLQPLLALYSTSCLPRMEQQLEQGNRSLQQLVQQAKRTVMDESECRQYDPDLLSWIDLDTPKAIGCAENMLQIGLKDME